MYTLDSLSKRMALEIKTPREKLLDHFLIAWLEGDRHIFEYPDRRKGSESEICTIHKNVHYGQGSDTWAHPYHLCRRSTLERMVNFGFFTDTHKWRVELQKSGLGIVFDDRDTIEFNQLCMKAASMVGKGELRGNLSYGHRNFVSEFIVTNRVSEKFAARYGVSLREYTQSGNMSYTAGAEKQLYDYFGQDFSEHIKFRPLDGHKFRRNPDTCRICHNYFLKIASAKGFQIQNWTLASISDHIKRDLKLEVSSDTVGKYIRQAFREKQNK